jgi:tRNA(fMet)-specific endonuclease VapC
MEEVVYNTNELINALKLGKLNLTGYTTIFNVVEFPKAVEFEDLIVIYPDLDDYQESVEISLALLRKGNPLPAIDILVATMCIRRNLALATKDRHFNVIKSVRKDFKLKI